MRYTRRPDGLSELRLPPLIVLAPRSRPGEPVPLNGAGMEDTGVQTCQFIYAVIKATYVTPARNMLDCGRSEDAISLKTSLVKCSLPLLGNAFRSGSGPATAIGGALSIAAQTGLSVFHVSWGRLDVPVTNAEFLGSGAMRSLSDVLP